MKSTDYLIQEHKIILRALDVLDAMSVLIESTRAIDQADVDRLLDFLRWFADSHHQAKEEAILFPALKAISASESRPIEHMIFEHGQERAMVEDIETDLRLSQLSDFVVSARRLSSTLRNHIYKEDHILFERVDALLSPEQDDAVRDRLNRFDTNLDKQMLQHRLKELHELEWKYLRR